MGFILNCMKRSQTFFLQVVIILIGVVGLALMLWEPQLEGRNVGATQFQIYFNDPFLAYIYAASIAFFAGLYYAFILCNYIAANEVFTLPAVKTLRNIKYCAITLVALIAAPVSYLFIVRPGDDIAGGVAIGLLIIFACAVVATAAAVFERLLQVAVDIKSENDLTV